MSRVQSSGVLTASKIVANGRNALAGVVVGADGTNAAIVNIYDGLSTGGTKILTLAVKATDRSQAITFTKSIVVDIGIYMEITGVGATATVLYGA